MACSIIRNSNNQIVRVNAPNGKESKLFNSILKVQPDKEQALVAWARVYTPSFKSWFGDWEKNQGSKVVDENGEPLLVFHGTDNENIEIFDSNKLKYGGLGIYFSTDLEDANHYRRSKLNKKNGVFSINGFNYKEIRINDQYYFLKKDSSLPVEKLSAEEFIKKYNITEDEFRLAYENYKKGGKVYPVFLNIRELEKVQDGFFGLDNKTSDVGGILTNDDSGKLSIYAVKTTNQIKSVFNEGSFSSKSGNIFLQTDGVPQSVANDQTLAKVKEAITKMGVSLVTLADYAKVSDIQTKGINGLADLTRQLIAVAEGHEGAALTEEMVHVAFAILQQTNPQMVTEMISKIDRFKIYKTTLEQYKNDPRYQLENGKPNIRKIKIEAVGKLIAEVIINKEQAVEQYPELREYENLSLIERFWNAIVDLFRGMYRKSDISIFEKAGAQVMEGVGTVDQITEDGVYLQKAVDPVEDIFNIYKEINDATADPVNRPDNSRFYKNDGVEYPSVTQKIKGGKNLDRTDFQTKIDNQMKTWGTEGHGYIQGFLQSLIDPITGLRREVPIAYDPITNLPTSVQKAIKDYILELVNSYKPGSRFLIEHKMVNKKEKIASTIDLTVFEPDDKVGFYKDTYDWKFTTVDKSQLSPDVHFLKQKEWKLQMGYYDKMGYNLGIKSSQTRRSRMIPFIMTYRPEVKGDWETPLKVKSIEIGKFDNLKETKLYLMPVSVDDESTGNKKLDKLIQSLRQEYNKLFKAQVSAEEKYAKTVRLQQISEAIRRLHMTVNFEPLVNVMTSFLNHSKDIIDSFADIDYDTIPQDQLLQKLRSLIELKRNANKYIGVDKVYMDLFDTKDMTAEQKQLLDKLEKRAASTERMLQKIDEVQKQYVVQLALKNGLSMEEIENPQKAIEWLSKTFLEASKLSSPIIKLGANLMMRSRKLAKVKANNAIKDFGDKLAALEKVARSRGKSAFDMIAKVENNSLTFFKKLDNKFFNEISKAKKEKNKQFFLDNMDVEEYNKLAKELIEKRTDELNKTIFSSDPEVDSQKREYKIKQLRNSVDINSKTFNGYDGFDFAELFSKTMKEEEKNFSQEYRDMLKVPEAYEMWKLFTGLNQRARNMGYLSGKGNSFFPLIEASFIQKVSQSGDFLGQSKDFLKDLYSVKVGEEHVYGSNYDVETQKVKMDVPKLHTRTGKDVKQLSRDLNRIGVLWINALEEYEETKKLEDVLWTLHSFEQGKKQLAVDPDTGALIEKGDEFLTEDKSQNADMFEVIINDFLYGQREDEKSFGNIQLTSLSEKFSKDEEKQAKRKANVKKGLDNLDTHVSALAVGLKALIAIPNYMGQNFLAYINAGSMYSASEYFKNEAMVIGDTVGLPALNTMQKGLIDLFVPLNEDIKGEQQREIALKSGNYAQWLSTWNFTDVMMATNSFPEKKLQITNAKSLIDNAMVVDGRIVNIRQYVKRQDQKRYKTLPYAERRALEKTQDARIKQLQETQSLEKIAKIENGRFVIPGVSDEEIARYSVFITEYGRKLSGQMNPDNKSNYWRDASFKSFMKFKGWIPKGISERGLDLQKNIELDEYSYGRTRLFIKTLVGLGLSKINRITDIIQGTDEGLRIMDEMLAEKKEAFFKKNGYELDITDEEFYDLVRRELSNQFKELGLLIGVIGLIFAANALKPDDDDDELAKARYKWWAKLTHKVADELAFYYNPLSFESMTKGSLVPAVGILAKTGKFLGALEEESRGRLTDNQELIDKSYPLKYGLDLIPGAAQAQRDYLPYIYPEFAKEMGIRVTAEARQGR